MMEGFGSKGAPLGKIKLVMKRYGLKSDLVLILAGLTMAAALAGCDSARSNAISDAAEVHAAAKVPGSAQPTGPSAAMAAERTPKAAADDSPDPRPVIACFGDSLTAGLGISPENSYPADLQRMLDEDGYHYHVVNEGVSGDTTKDGLERISRVLDKKPRIVVLEFGGNDGLRGLPVSVAEKNLAAMIAQLQRNRAKVALAGISLPPQYGGDYISQFDAMYPTLAKQFHVPLLPFLLKDVWGVEGDIQPDGVHPTAQGAKQVAANVEQLIQPMLKK